MLFLNESIAISNKALTFRDWTKNFNELLFQAVDSVFYLKSVQTSFSSCFDDNKILFCIFSLTEVIFIDQENSNKLEYVLALKLALYISIKCFLVLCKLLVCLKKTGLVFYEIFMKLNKN
ncbi:hypothetical protein MAR_009287, partial [Mya arenaria]